MTAAPAQNDGMGSLLYSDGSCRFRVWTPFASKVQLQGPGTAWGASPIDLLNEGNGNWSGVIQGVKPLDLYQYLITNQGGPGNDNSQVWTRADARALQVQSSDGASASYVIAPFNQSNRPAFQTPAFENFILYQMHVGSVAGLNDVPTLQIKNRTATFLQIIPKLSYIKSLGFNAIALLPIGDVHDDLNAGGVGEGYGTCDMFAPEDWYGTTASSAVADLLALVDAAHSIGLAVIFDVVYSHSAIDDNRYYRYDGNCYGNGPYPGGEYFQNGNDSRFGSGFAFWQQEIKDFFLDNARMFLGDYRCDGLRFDATQLIQADALQFIAGNLQNEFPDKYLIAEYNPGDQNSASGAMDPFLRLRRDLGFGQPRAGVQRLERF
jgi:1,4-alpha-glucan branching enzyme